MKYHLLASSTAAASVALLLACSTAGDSGTTGSQSPGPSSQEPGVGGDGDAASTMPPGVVAPKTNPACAAGQRSTVRFGAERRFNAGALSQYQVRLADLDGDGDLDIFTGYSVLLNDGKANFTLQQPTLGVVMVHGGFAIADVDHDGDIDLVVRMDGAVPKTQDVVVWLNDGHAKFTKVTSTLALEFYILGTASNSFDVADYDNDGFPDVSVRPPQNTGEPRSAYFANDGHGGFSATARIYPGPKVDTGDCYPTNIDNDGLVDFFCYGGPGPTKEQVTLVSYVQTPPTFARRSTWVSHGDGLQTTVGDFNGDGKLDIVYRDALTFGDGTGNYGAWTDIDAPSVFARDSIDADCDGHLDLIALVSDEPITSPGRSYDFRVLLNDGLGGFSRSRSVVVSVSAGTGDNGGAYPSNDGTYDLNGDGIPDLIFPSEDGKITVELGE